MDAQLLVPGAPDSWRWEVKECSTEEYAQLDGRGSLSCFPCPLGGDVRASALCLHDACCLSRSFHCDPLVLCIQTPRAPVAFSLSSVGVFTLAPALAPTLVPVLTPQCTAKGTTLASTLPQEGWWSPHGGAVNATSPRYE